LISELLRAAVGGRAADPALEDFSPWPTERRRHLWPSVDAGYLYSRHQLIGLDVAMPLVTTLSPQPAGQRVTWHLVEEDRPDARAREALLTWRSLAVTLSALDTYYWPFITHVVYHNREGVWRSERLAFDPSAMLSWLDVPPEQILKAERDLRFKGTFRDDLGDFYEIVRWASPDAWETMSGDALTARSSASRPTTSGARSPARTRRSASSAAPPSASSSRCSPRSRSPARTSTRCTPS
jgi:hypothetical protein